MKHILSILFLLLLASGLRSGASEYLCRQISVDDGLSQSQVTDIVRDGRGFLWIGSRFGLNRYDFSGVTNYYSEKSDTSSIPDNSIAGLFVDSRDTVWVAGESGVAYYSRHNDSFVRLTCEGVSLNARSFYDEGNGLLIGGGGTLYFYDYACEKTVKLQTKGGSNYFYTAIHNLKPGLYVLATRWDGLWLFDRQHATITSLPDCDEKRIMASMIDSTGRLWISVYGRGVFCYERDGSRTHILKSDINGLGNDVVRDIVEKEGHIWLATDGGGINIYNPQESRFIKENDEVLSQLGAVTRLYIDRHDNIFGGTARKGAFAIRQVAIRTFQTSSSNSLNTSIISSIFRDETEGKLWIGTDGNGIFTHREGSALFNPVTTTSGLKIISMTDYDRHTLIVSTFDKGIILLDKSTGRMSRAPAQLESLYECNKSKGISMFFHRLSNGSVALLTDHLAIFNPSDGSVKEHSQAPNEALVPFYNNRGLLMYSGHTFVGEYDILTGSSRTIHSQKGRITCAAFDGDRTIYIASDASVSAIDINSGAVTPLADINIGYVSAIAVEDGHLWVGSNNSLLMKDLKNGDTIRFGRYDGVEANEYMPEATQVTDGYLYFGGVNGLVRIDRHDITRFHTPGPDPAISVSGLEIDGSPAFNFLFSDYIEVEPSHSHVRIKIISDGNNALYRPHYRFFIRSGGQEQIVETFDNFINLGNLDTGTTYDISAATVRPDGKAGAPQHLLKVAMMAPWYDSDWTWLVMLVIAAIGFLVFDQHRRRNNKRRVASQLEAVRSMSLEKEIAFLVNTNYALRTPLTMIYAPIKMLIERLGKGEQVDIENELQHIYRNTKRMRDVIDMAMELHNVGTLPQETAQIRQDLRLSLRDAKALHSAEIENKHIDVTIEASDTLPDILLSAPDRMRVVLDILMQNAVRRSAEGSTIKITLGVVDGNCIRIEFSDHGPILDESSLESLFSSTSVHESNSVGNSLGLAYAHNIIETLGGRSGALNNPQAEGGATVWIEIPVDLAPLEFSRKSRRPATAPTHNPPQEAPFVNVDTSDLTVVVVEEDNDLCMFVSSQLAGHFKRVLHAFNGKDALLLIRQEMPDIVVSSVLLPFKSGIELCLDIKSSPETRHIPVIILTTLKEGPQLENAYGAGADSYLTKPFDMNVLLMRMRSLLHTRSVLKQRYSTDTTERTTSRGLPNADESFILKIDRLITENIDNPNFNVDTLAREMNMSRTVIYSKFKAITGNTIAAYINDYRLRKAKEMLSETNLSISDISEHLGFSTQRYFSTFFKDRTGLTPSAFRSSNQ